MFRKFLMKSAHCPSENPFETTDRGDDALPVRTEAFDDVERFHLTDDGSDVNLFWSTRQLESSVSPSDRFDIAKLRQLLGNLHQMIRGDCIVFCDLWHRDDVIRMSTEVYQGTESVVCVLCDAHGYHSVRTRNAYLFYFRLSIAISKIVSILSHKCNSGVP